jgi:sucrose-6-phosphate hydrolase SacC (GH32 family)
VIAPGAAAETGFRLLARDGKLTEVGYNTTSGELFLDRTRSGVTDFSKEFPSRTAAPLATRGEPLRLTILVDRSSVEVFAQNGLITMTNLVYPLDGARGIEFYSRGGEPGAVAVDVWELSEIPSP